MISLCMLVRHPPIERLAMLIEFMSRVAREVIIVDTGSSESDIEKMRALGATVISHVWKDDFSEARNVGLAAATQPWTLVLDPDELPSYEMLSFLQVAVIPPTYPIGYMFWTVNYWDGSVGQPREYHWHIRLFRTGHGRFYRKVHELVALDGMPESESRSINLMVTPAPTYAYLIHSKTNSAITRDDALYAQLGEVSK